MRSTLLCIVLLACCGKKPVVERPPPGYDPIPDQSLWLLHRIARAKPGAVDIELRLDNGKLSIRKHQRWVRITLAELTEELRERRHRFHEQQQALGGTGFTTGRHGLLHASKLQIGVQLSPETPCLHLFWIVLVCEEEMFDKLKLSTGGRSFHLYLPWNIAIEYTEPPPHVAAVVDLNESGAFRVDGQDCAGPNEFTARIEAARRRAKQPEHLVAIPAFPAATPVSRLLDLFEALLAAGVPRLADSMWTEEEIRSTMLAIPSRRVRQLELLPAPTKK